MSVEGIHAITSKFKERWLNPLQFPGSHRSVDQRLSDLENAKQGQQPANSRIKIRVKGQKSKAAAPQASDTSSHARVMTREGIKNGLQNQADLQRVREDHSSDLDGWHAEHSQAATDLLHTFNQRMNSAQAQRTPSTSGGWGAFNDTFRSTARSTSVPTPGAQPSAPLNTPAAPAARPKPQRVTQPGLFGPSQVAPVRSQQQFGQAAKAAPSKSGPTPARKPRVTQPGLFPKSAVKPPQ